MDCCVRFQSFVSLQGHGPSYIPSMACHFSAPAGLITRMTVRLADSAGTQQTARLLRSYRHGPHDRGESTHAPHRPGGCSVRTAAVQGIFVQHTFYLTSAVHFSTDAQHLGTEVMGTEMWRHCSWVAASQQSSFFVNTGCGD